MGTISDRLDQLESAVFGNSKPKEYNPIELYETSKKPYCCPVCGGRQQITAREDGLIPVDAHGMCGPQYVPCPACGGTGIVWGE